MNPVCKTKKNRKVREVPKLFFPYLDSMGRAGSGRGGGEGSRREKWDVVVGWCMGREV
jgi:hypothetical protein